jgi:hypothetical protein
MCANQIINDDDSEKNQSSSKSPRWLIGPGLISAGGILTYAVQTQNWRLAQITSIAGVILLVAGVAVLAVTLPSAAARPQSNASSGPWQETERYSEANRSIRAQWLQRLVYVPAIGLAVITLFAVQYTRWANGEVASTASVGYIAAGAAWLVGALVGFLFGIPHTRQAEAGTAKPGGANPAASSDISPTDPDNRYEPSTSLEQISDWLTKIIVGVGLTQLGKIPGKLKDLANYIASGMGDHPSNQAFAMGIAIYFSVCGFLLGYLFARLYLMEAFRAAELKRVQEQISHQMRDLQAKDLIESHLDLGKPEIPVQVIDDAVYKASDSAKADIFRRAKKARVDHDYSEAIASRTKPIFNALAAVDKAKIYHQNHGHLGYVYQDLGSWGESERELTEAIQIRNRLGHSGWKYYELARAIARIHLDTGLAPSQKAIRDEVLADLRVAYSDPRYRDSKNDDAIEKNKAIQDWLGRNDLSVRDLMS